MEAKVKKKIYLLRLLNNSGFESCPEKIAKRFFNLTTYNFTTNNKLSSYLVVS